MQGILYDEQSFLVFLFVTLLLGGLGAWMTGRACAMTWRTRQVMAIYVLILTAGVRFIHFSIFNATLLSLHYYVVDAVVLEAIAFLGFQFKRTRQMVTQYYWLYEASGPFAWKAKG
ncbi:DUF6867 family protein [Oryzibacter oryziterrae]|uniref:DUF6867 family protein n=1 Tax=Oryzibacter oryziterrae TaxID=2766474 RepID=UPI001F2D2CC7|nr:hypothetical protein [Oryzibacter oryziterrae]